MPKVKPLEQGRAARTIAARFAGSPGRVGLADRLRQLNTRFGIRPMRVFLVWTRFDGAERGEGSEKVLSRVEILPTPRVSDLTSITLHAYAAGKLPDGSLRVDEISAGQYTRDQLAGLKVPGYPEDFIIPPNVSFWYEIVIDDRTGDKQPVRMRYRRFSEPTLQAGKVQWMVILERASEDESRDGKSNVGVDREQDEFA